MKLSAISAPGTLTQQPSGIDIDVASNVAPAIMKNMASLETLLKLLPGGEDLCGKLAELRDSLSSRLSSPTVVEVQGSSPTILDYDAEKPLGQQRAHIHGVGSATVEYLPTKITREAGFVSDVISEVGQLEVQKSDYDEILEKYNELGRWTDQLLRTATTLKQACSEMARKRQSVPRQEQLEDVAPGTHSNDIDRMIADNFVMAMYETMKPGLGDRAWVAISKRLRSQGMPQEIVEKMINRAVILSEKS